MTTREAMNRNTRARELAEAFRRSWNLLGFTEKLDTDPVEHARGMPRAAREVFASLVGSGRPPSDATWALVVTRLEEMERPMADPFTGLTEADVPQLAREV